MKTTIHTLSELQRLRSFKTRRGIRDVVIELPGSLDETRRLETEINRSLRACGCEIGASFVAIGLLTLVTFTIMEPTRLAWASPKTWFGIVGALCALALAGKIIGLAIANTRLHRAIDRLEQITSQRTAPE